MTNFVVPPRHLLRQRGFPFLMKRVMDCAVSTVVLILISPLMILISILLLIFQGRPILFKQRRPGRFERIFTIYKFRTMQNCFDDNGKLLPDNHRITRIGNALRILYLDELPQLINVIRGEMSLVGNRPLLCEYLKHMTSEQRKRCLVIPGLTTIDTVKFSESGVSRYHLSWEDQFKLEVWYVDNWTFWLDMKIIVKTILVLIKNEDSLKAIGGERESFIKDDRNVEQIKTENENNRLLI